MEEQEHTAAEVCKFYLENKCRFGENCRNLHAVAEAGGPSLATTRDPPKVKGNHPGSLEPNPTEETTETLKKSRMRTAQEVINRLLWDPELDQNDFSICYLDRFVGPVQVPLPNYRGAEDQPEDLIPQHRIQKILYRERVVWDKNERIDLVFGSTGHKGTIIDLLNDIDQ